MIEPDRQQPWQCHINNNMVKECHTKWSFNQLLHVQQYVIIIRTLELILWPLSILNICTHTNINSLTAKLMATCHKYCHSFVKLCEHDISRESCFHTILYFTITKNSQRDFFHYFHWTALQTLPFSPPLLSVPPRFLQPISCPWNPPPAASLAYSAPHPAPYCSVVPLHPSLHLSSFPPPLLATLASFGSWWGVTVLPLSRRESPLTKKKKVFVCACGCWRVYNMIACSCVVLYICVCSVCVWPVEVTDVRIVLSQQEKRWFTCQGTEGQEGR